MICCRDELDMGLAEMVRLLLQHGADASIKCFVSYLSVLCFYVFVSVC